MAFSWLLRKRDRQRVDVNEEISAGMAPAICLRVDDGLLMAWGPDGDPIPPALVRSACAEDPKSTLQLESGETVDRRRVLEVLDAQQTGPLADRPNDAWVEAMLCLGGAFEPTPDELLQKEPLGTMPPRPRDADASAERAEPDTVVLTPLTFDEAERKAMAKADAFLLRGLQEGVALSAGHLEPLLDGWVLRPQHLRSLAIERPEHAAKSAEIDVTAVTFNKKGKRWPVASKRIALA